MMSKFYYGVKGQSHLIACIKKAVTTFGGGHKARQLLAGTCCAESDFATFPDVHPEKLGVGVTQFDQIGFDDVKLRTRTKHKKRFERGYSVKFDEIELKDLAYNPELALAFTRLKYLLVPEPLPCSDIGQALYWKKYYNTYHPNAAGSIEKYLDDWKRFTPVCFR